VTVRGGVASSGNAKSGNDVSSRVGDASGHATPPLSYSALVCQSARYVEQPPSYRAD